MYVCSYIYIYKYTVYASYFHGLPWNIRTSRDLSGGSGLWWRDFTGDWHVAATQRERFELLKMHSWEDGDLDVTLEEYFWGHIFGTHSLIHGECMVIYIYMDNLWIIYG